MVTIGEYILFQIQYANFYITLKLLYSVFLLSTPNLNYQTF
jgi:hypothetical protein